MTNWKCCWYCRIILYALALTVGGLQTHGSCNNTQYVELGKAGIVQCFFDAGMYGIYWYDSEDVTQSPFFFYERSKKSGQGYTSGEYDVEPNGSLVIRNVTLKHDHVFTVACLANKDGQAVSVRVTVVVIVKPTQLHPFVSQCNGENNCYSSYSKVPILNCFVADSRPAVRLQWFRRTIHSDQKLPSEKFVHNHTNSVFSTYADLRTSLLTVSHYAVAVCKASSVQPMLPITESIVLLEGELKYSFLKIEQKYIEKGEKMTLDCLVFGKDLIVVWKKGEKANFENVVGIVSEKLVFRTSEYDVNREKSLVLNKTSISHEGEYVCFHSDGMSTAGTLYKVTVYINPVPNYPVVEGCGSQTPCVIVYENLHGELIFKLLGIRPVVSLKWRIADENLSEKLTFFDEKVIVLPNAEAYDVVVTTSFSLQDRSMSKITVECFSFGKFTDVINISTKQVDLIFPGETSEIKADLISLPMSWLILFATVISVLLALGYGWLLLKGTFYRLFKRKAGRFTSEVPDTISQDNCTETTEETPLTAVDNIDSSMTNITYEKFAKLRNAIGLSKDGNELFDIFKTSQPTFETKPVLLRFFERLNLNDSNAVMVFYHNGEAEATALDLQKDDKVLSFVQETAEPTIVQQSECNVSCRDILFTIYHSCKASFRQEFVLKMSSCNMAVPFLLPNPVQRDRLEFLLSDLQKIKKEWREGRSVRKVTVTEHAFPTVAALRIGEIGVSKSNILNLIIGSLHWQHRVDSPKFLTSSEDDYPSSWSRGTVEAVWFLPTERFQTYKYSLCTATCFLNLRGRMGTESTKLQENFLFTFSSCVVVFVQKSSFDQHYDSLVNEWSEKTHVILVVMSDKYNKGQTMPRILRKEDCLTVIIFERCSELKVAREVFRQILLALQEDETTKTLQREGQQICENLSIQVK